MPEGDRPKGAVVIKEVGKPPVAAPVAKPAVQAPAAAAKEAARGPQKDEVLERLLKRPEVAKPNAEYSDLYARTEAVSRETRSALEAMERAGKAVLDASAEFRRLEVVHSAAKEQVSVLNARGVKLADKRDAHYWVLIDGYLTAAAAILDGPVNRENDEVALRAAQLAAEGWAKEGAPDRVENLRKVLVLELQAAVRLGDVKLAQHALSQAREMHKDYLSGDGGGYDYDNFYGAQFDAIEALLNAGALQVISPMIDSIKLHDLPPATEGEGGTEAETAEPAAPAATQNASVPDGVTYVNDPSPAQEPAQPGDPLEAFVADGVGTEAAKAAEKGAQTEAPKTDHGEGNQENGGE